MAPDTGEQTMPVSLLSLVPESTSLGAGVPLPPSMIWLFIVIGILALLGAFVRSPLFKGWLGEAIVNLGLKVFLDKGTYHLVRNVTLPCDDGTTQIDHVIVSRFGIFVVETKNMRGWIFGTEQDAKWTQKFRKSSFHFQNPLRQNYKHVAVMAETTGLPPEAFKSMIMFIGDAKLKTGVPTNVMTHGLATFIKSHRTPILTEDQVDHALAAIAELRLNPGIKTHVQHVRNVRAIVDRKGTAVSVANQPAVAPLEAMPDMLTDVAAPSPVAKVSAAESPICPKCGRSMVQRVARSGPQAGKAFWGCSAYPRCRGTRGG
jgi:hypothetical protein